jgi:uncharacterized protein
MRLFLDANIIFAAAISPKGRCSSFFELAQNNVCSLVTSPYVLEEVQRNLQAKYPQALTRLEQALLPVLLIKGELFFERIEWAIAQGLPPKDAPILAAAMESGAALLVTGDKNHFGLLYGRVFEELEVVDTITALNRVLG